MTSREIRELIIVDAKEGIPVEEISRVLRVGESTIWKLLKQERETGSIESRCKGRKSSLTEEQYEKMIALVEAEPDVTLEEIRERLELPIHKSQISNLLRKAGYSFKKRWSTPRNVTGRTLNRNGNCGRSSNHK